MRRKPRFITWFKLGILLGLFGLAGALCTPYPERLYNRLFGPPRVKVVVREVTRDVPSAPPETSQPSAPVPEIGQTTPWRPEDNFSMPEIVLPPFPPPLPERVEAGLFTHLSEFFRRGTYQTHLQSMVHFKKGTTASQDRVRKSPFLLKLQMEVFLPHAANGKELLHANPKLPQVLRNYEQLMASASVSPWFAALYAHKQNSLRYSAAKLQPFLDSHNYYDTDTVLELQGPDNGAKVLWLQADMDVVSDGSDGDRLEKMPERILNSDNFQPMTSYRWKKRTKFQNPVVPVLEAKITKLSKAKGNHAAEIAALRKTVGELKIYSYLLSEYDPFIVLPGAFREGGASPFRPSMGDYVAVVYGNRVFPAIVGDFGPKRKSGEASLRLAKALNPQASVYRRPVSSLGVSYIIFPGSREPEAGPIDYARLNARVRELLESLGGLGEQAQFCEMPELLPQRSSPAP
ncbi:MAG: glycoside hydrolase family 75 protein [Akkermansia sp.]